MFNIKKIVLKFTMLQVILAYVCFALLLSACDATTSCRLQAVAGGSQHCEQLEIGE